MLILRRNSETQVLGGHGSETRSSRSVEPTRLSHFGFETRVSCLLRRDADLALLIVAFV